MKQYTATANDDGVRLSRFVPVSYTHLEVYKRQARCLASLVVRIVVKPQ